MKKLYEGTKENRDALLWAVDAMHNYAQEKLREPGEFGYEIEQTLLELDSFLDLLVIAVVG